MTPPLWSFGSACNRSTTRLTLALLFNGPSPPPSPAHALRSSHWHLYMVEARYRPTLRLQRTLFSLCGFLSAATGSPQGSKDHLSCLTLARQE